MRKYALLALFALHPPFLSAARLTLRDGSVIYGQFINGTLQTIVFQDDNGVRRRFDLKQVQTIDFGRSSQQANREDPHARNDWAVVPAGGFVTVRPESDIVPNPASAGALWAAVIVQDVMDEAGKVVIPRGTAAALAVRCVADGSTYTSASYVLDLDSVRIGGRRYMVNTADAPAGHEGALGTLIATSPEGLSVPVLTAGHEVRVPAQTVLHFRLEAPLRLRDAGSEPRP
jgi:hypothetical protein